MDSRGNQDRKELDTKGNNVIIVNTSKTGSLPSLSILVLTPEP